MSLIRRAMRHRTAPLILVSGLALLIRLAAAQRTVVIFNDGMRFIDIARSMEQGRWMAALSDAYHPLYSLLIRAVYPLVGDWAQAGVWVCAICGSAAVVPLMIFVRSAFDRSSAIAAGLLFAVHPWLAVFSSDVQSEGLYLLLFLSSVALLFTSFMRGSPCFALGAGIFSGLAYLTRPEGIGLAFVGVALAVWSGLRRRWTAARSIVWIGAILLGAGMIATPYVVAMHQISGVWTLSQKKSVLRIVTGSGPQTATQQAPWRTDPELATMDRCTSAAAPLRCTAAVVAPRREASGASVELGQRSVLHRLAGAFCELLSNVFTAFRPEMLVVMFIGIASVRGLPTDRAIFTLAIVGAYALVLLGLSSNIGYLSRRHVLPPLTPALGYAGLGAIALGQWVAGALRREESGASAGLRPALAISLGVALVTAIALPKVLTTRRAPRLAQRLAAEWVSDQPGECRAVAAESYRTAFYAERDFVSLWDEQRPRSARELFAAEADLLIVDERNLAGGEALQELCSDEVTLVHSVAANGRRVLVYRLGTDVGLR